MELALWILVLPALLPASYLFALAALAWRRSPGVPAAGTRFAIVVPAHDEEVGIARTVSSLGALEWPRDRFEIVVVADNCTDRTAERAAEAGATVLVRHDPVRRGKGRALEFAFAGILARGGHDAVVVVDADTVADANLLSAFAARLGEGEKAIQARYRVLNPLSSWRTRLMALAFALVNDVRSLGRERLRLSCGLRGNGMCFSVAALGRVPYDAYSIVEDAEYGIRLGEAGIRVAYAAEASVAGEMVSGERASRSQRVRWESGRRALLRERGPSLLAAAIRRRSLLLADLFADLAVPPLASLASYLVVAGGLAGAWALRGGGDGPFLAALAGLVLLAGYVARGWIASGLGPSLLLWLPFVPVYVAWKLVLRIGGPARPPREFVRTAREGAPPPRDASDTDGETTGR